MYEARKTIKGIDTRFVFHKSGDHTYIADVYTAKKYRNIPEHSVVKIDTKNYLVQVNGQPVGAFLLALKQEKGRRRSKRSSSRKRRPRKEFVSVFKASPPKALVNKRKRNRIVEIVELDDNGTPEKYLPKVEPTYFDMIKGFLGLTLSASAFMLKVVQQCVSFVYYEIIDWGPLSLPIFGIVLNLWYPDVVATLGIWSFSFVVQPKKTLLSLFRNLVRDIVISDFGQYLPAFVMDNLAVDHVLFENSAFRILMVGASVLLETG